LSRRPAVPVSDAYVGGVSIRAGAGRQQPRSPAPETVRGWDVSGRSHGATFGPR
jgi:hypothetical protein